MAASTRDRIKEETVQKAVNALLKWKKSNSQPDHEVSDEEEQQQEEGDDFIYLSVTLKKAPSKIHTHTPPNPLRHSLLSPDYSSLNLCLIVDGKRITSESAHKVFYKKKRKIPVPVDLKADGSNWKEEIEMSFKSSLLCLSSGTCSVVRVGKWGVTESKEIVENVFEAIDGILEIVPRNGVGSNAFT
ncbi:hypothetical protein DH2020_043790 [Rehmannia glutinosa]|uniref:Uncharacterized protein n=1 Tax=Rehmannia glutinosa TaxID=99300 RepID=A0ABR0UIM8_REHGL